MFCENSKYLKNIGDISVIMCDETISVLDIALTKMRNTIATNVTKNCDIKKIRDWYIWHTALLVIILLLIITIICYDYENHRST